MGYLDAQEGASSRTAFRLAEKRYKQYKQPSTNLRQSKNRSTNVPATDISEVLDLRKYSDSLLTDGKSKIDGVSLATTQFDDDDTPVLVIDGYPGFYFISGALSVQEQYLWIQESLTSFPEPPNRTNHNALYGSISDLWVSAQHKRVLTEKEISASQSQETEQPAVAQQKSSKATPTFFENGNTRSDDNRVECLEADAAAVAEADRLGSFAIDLPDNERKSLGHSDGPSGILEDTLSKEYVTRARVVHRSSESLGKEWHFVAADEAGRRESPSAVSSSPSQISAETLLRKLRWATIGLHFDWQEKAYNPTIPHKKLSPELAKLASRLAAPAMDGDEFRAEAAIVNFYGAGDMLGGHIDDMEADWRKPIVSISLGCKSIFLLGGTSRDEVPVAMFLRSGDVVLMAGPARQRFHGIPRIFVDPTESDLPGFFQVAKEDDDGAGTFHDYISKSRININIRQVF